ncbi:MAG: hypothetical protein ACXAEU_23405 [Candidatus Hodarchaeales archaeon]|jgi:hypothetical protein
MKQWIDDIFIIDSSGIPFWSFCYGGENCKLYPDHVLQTGMLAAFYQFGREFGQKIVQRVEFDTGNFFFYFEDPIITVFATTSDVEPNIIKDKVKEATVLFKKQFSDKLADRTIIQPEDYQAMGDLLEKEGIVDYKPKMPLYEKIFGVKDKKKWYHKLWWKRLWK